MKLRTHLILTAACAMLAGCAGEPTQKEEARDRWTAARGGVLAELAREQLASGHLDEADATLKQALSTTGGNAELHVLRARLQIERNDLTAARASLDAARALSPAPEHEAMAEHLAGVVAERWQEPTRAAEHHARAAALQPNEPAYLIAHAEALVAADRAAEAAATLEARVLHFEGSAAIRDALGQVYDVLGERQKAVDCYRQAAILSPDDADLAERHALAAAAAGQHREALRLLGKLGDAANERASLQLARGQCHLTLGETSLARAAFQRAARLDDRLVPAWLGLARTTLEGGDLPRAALAADRAVALAPDSTDALLLSGLIRLRQDRLAEAAQQFVALTRLDANDSTAPLLYGVCLRRLGRHEEAARYFARAAAIDRGDALASDLLADTRSRLQ